MYKAILAYDGTRYFGWQKTKTGPSIQGELQKAISQITQETPLPEAASRTDRGVHAEGQVVQFSLTKPIEPKKLQKALNAVLPHDIRLLALSHCTFHPTLDALGKEYHYHLCLGPVEDPMCRLYAWHFRSPLDLGKMETEAKSLIGTHDFSAFANESEKDPICTLESIRITPEQIAIKGNRFLYKMVRNLVGTLLYIGCGKRAHLAAILASRDRKQAGVTAPAHGLYLHQVFYPLH
jgi:tRNA pseudouridine38-40 synthase